MKFDVMLTGVGGEGVLTTQVMIARAANIEGHYVRGVQLHGLAQRGGVIPTFVRFGSEKEVSSPGIMQANADLILAFEALEAVRATYYARKEKTTFVINDYSLVPIYASLFNIPYLTMSEIIKRIKPFAKRIHVFKASHLGREKLGNAIFGNTILVGVVTGIGLLPLKEDSLREAIRVTAPREMENNVKAFELGLQLGREKRSTR
ncbi:2-oxoacid:acceptor oxidoreductase family protein [Candidatus Bathyarchaeota archaeon]|nr:2-oxoacid:acceptor oxidoreductase family protein [Candidatus Bathyarchaeota archaeon]